MNLIEEIQRNLIATDCDVLSVLRMSKIVASKLSLFDFEKWLENELNGYSTEDSNVPKYRSIKGELKAWNPYHGWIPVVLPNSEIADRIEINTIYQPISEIIDHYNKSKEHPVGLSVSKDLTKILNKGTYPSLNTNYQISFSSSQLKKIIEQVKDTILQWMLTLEGHGIKGFEMSFTNEEIKSAKKLSSNMVTNNYYNSQIVYGDNNKFSYSYEDSSKDIDNIITEIKKSNELNDADKEIALIIANDVKESINKKDSPKAIKYVLSSLKDFVVGAGASLLAAYIQSKLGF